MGPARGSPRVDKGGDLASRVHVAIELSGEHPALARAEAEAVLETLGGAVTEPLERVVLGRCPTPPGALAERMAMAWHVVEVAGTAELTVEAIVALADQVPLDGERFAVRCTRLDPALPRELPVQVARHLGAALAERGTVDLEDPEVVVRVLLDEQAVVGRQVASVDRPSYEARHPEERPFFSPVSLHPRLARCLVNLSRVRADERLWDPFCGTGGLVLEAALAGAQAIGSDLDGEMIEGTQRTLEAFGAEAALVEGDVAEVAKGLEPVQAIVTDPPYGRASTTNKEALHGLYERFFQAAASVLEPGRHLVCILPEPEAAELAGERFELVDEHAWYVHGTLTRHILVFARR